MVFLTDFGDTAVLLPMAAAILMWLFAMRGAYGAAWWIAALLLVMGGVGFMKIYFFACLPPGQLQSPSGHTSLGALVYGAIAVIVIRETAGWRRGAVVAAASGLVIAIALSRLVLRAHTLPEIVVGLGVGIAALSLFAFCYLQKPGDRVAVMPLLLGCVAILALLHGTELHAEEMLRAIGLLVRGQPGACI